MFTYTVDAERIAALNDGLRALAAARGASYVDLHPAFAEDGELKAEYTHDGLHLNGAGYLAWRAALAPYLAR
jgi:lysophospholipase L1-like esterase